MSDESSGSGAGQAMGKASGMYNDVVGQAGPGMAANASLLLIIGIGVASLINFLSLDGGKFNYNFYTSFGGGILGVCGIIIIGGVLISRVVSGDIKPLNKKTVLSLLGLVGLIEGIVLVLATLVQLTVDSNFLSGSSKFSLFISGVCWTVFVLAAALWATAEARKS